MELRIKKLRTQHEASQEAFTNHIGISHSYFGEIEKGRHNVAVINFEKIARCLGVTLEGVLRLQLLHRQVEGASNGQGS